MFTRAWRRPFVFTGDSRRHQFLYDASAIFKIFTALAFAATLLFAFRGWSGTLAVGVTFVVLWALWMGTAAAEYRERRRLARPVTERDVAEAVPAEEERLERAVQNAEARMGLEILAGLVLVAIVLAVFLMGREMLGLGALLIFAYLTVFGAPYWAAAIHERGDEERQRLSR
jgi:hypothetical protein